MSRPASARGRPPQHRVDEAWLALRTEEVLEPDLPIVDPHLHLRNHHQPYGVPKLLADLACGHHLRATVFVECGFMYRCDGDPRLSAAAGARASSPGAGRVSPKAFPEETSPVHGWRPDPKQGDSRWKNV